MYKWLLLLLSMPLLASDLQREERWADQIVDAILVGEPVWLDASGHRFLTIFTRAEKTDVQRAVLLVHGVGVHPDWPDVINPLRERLPDHGWATLSLQMPVLDTETDVNGYYPIFPEVLPRIDAGLQFLRNQGYRSVVIAGHSLGSQMAAYWLAQSDATEIKGMIGIGMSGAEQGGHGATPDYLATITVPVLDIYGEHDLKSVTQTLVAKAAAAKRAGNTGYTQVEVAGADHMFQGEDDALIEAVVGWLEQR